MEFTVSCFGELYQNVSSILPLLCQFAAVLSHLRVCHTLPTLCGFEWLASDYAAI